MKKCSGECFSLALVARDPVLKTVASFWFFRDFPTFRVFPCNKLLAVKWFLKSVSTCLPKLISKWFDSWFFVSFRAIYWPWFWISTSIMFSIGCLSSHYSSVSQHSSFDLVPLIFWFVLYFDCYVVLFFCFWNVPLWLFFASDFYLLKMHQFYVGSCVILSSMLNIII